MSEFFNSYSHLVTLVINLAVVEKGQKVKFYICGCMVDNHGRSVVNGDF